MWIETDTGVVNLDFVAAIALRDEEIRLLMPPTSPDIWFGKDGFVSITRKTPAHALEYYNRIVKQLNVLSKDPAKVDQPDPD